MTCHKRPAVPLNPQKLEELALGYAARFATSAAKLEAYLVRKLRERGWDADKPPDPATLVAKIVDLGYVDDEAYARAKAGGLLRRGYGPRRVSQALTQAGISEDLRHDVAASEGEARQAALALARKRRFGPFGTEAPDRARREKQIAAMLRAGHRLDAARELIEADSVASAEQWAMEGDDA